MSNMNISLGNAAHCIGELPPANYQNELCTVLKDIKDREKLHLENPPPGTNTSWIITYLGIIVLVVFVQGVIVLGVHYPQSVIVLGGDFCFREVIIFGGNCLRG